MHQIYFEQARDYALQRLADQLPARLLYHSLAHTRDIVVPEAEQLAEQHGIAGEAQLLLRTAAYFHDIGFVQQQAEHERIGAQIAAEVLPRFGYSPAHIQTINGIIMATRIPQTPHTILEQLLADADLAILGRADFLQWNGQLRAELAASGTTLSDERWYGSQLQFMQSHRYWTAAAQRCYDTHKLRNCEVMRSLLNQAQDQQR